MPAKNPFNLSHALMIYEFGKNNPRYQFASTHDYYIETHKIKNGKLGTGKALSNKALRGLIDSFILQHEESESGLIPKNLLAKKRDTYVWYTPSEKKYLFFIKSLNIPNGIAHVPAILWILQDRNLYIHALKSNSRPDLKTKIYQAPFHNIHRTGNVCMGSAKVGKGFDTISKRLTAWETGFWKSQFSHLIETSTVKNPYNINVLWKELVESLAVIIHVTATWMVRQKSRD